MILKTRERSFCQTNWRNILAANKQDIHNKIIGKNTEKLEYKDNYTIHNIIPLSVSIDISRKVFS